MVVESIVWRISPLSAPRIRRHCPHCAQERPFASTERFRLNAHKRRIDVWLIYACTECDATWNFTVLSRAAQSAIDRDLFERMTRNDPDTARAVAFDRAGLARAGARLEPSLEYRVARPAGDVSRARAARAPLRIHIAMTQRCRIRVDRLLSSELGPPDPASSATPREARSRSRSRPHPAGPTPFAAVFAAACSSSSRLRCSRSDDTGLEHRSAGCWPIASRSSPPPRVRAPPGPAARA